MKKNAFLTFVFALVPGFGQMYQGYMRRGVSLLFWFCAIIGVSVLARMEFLLVFLVLVWAYSFFDTFNIRNLSPEQRAVFGDSYIPGGGWAQRGWAGKVLRGASSGKIIGWVLIAVGIVILYNNLWDSIYWDLYQIFPALANWVNRLPALVIAVVVILLGVRMLRGRKPPLPPTDDDDTTEFTGGSPHA